MKSGALCWPTTAAHTMPMGCWMLLLLPLQMRSAACGCVGIARPRRSTNGVQPQLGYTRRLRATCCSVSSTLGVCVAVSLSHTHTPGAGVWLRPAERLPDQRHGENEGSCGDVSMVC
jgi:hypothetical protein